MRAAQRVSRRGEHQQTPSPRRRSGGRDRHAAQLAAHGVLSLTFSDGVEGEVAVLDRMRGSVFAEARALQGFARAAVDEETGTVAWPGGADLAPDTLYVRVQTGAWPNSDFPPDVAARPRPNISPTFWGRSLSHGAARGTQPSAESG